MENKTSKYFKYAIGEIILVVIGILIALQINNWNNLRIESLKEQMFLKNLQSDIKANLIEYNKVYTRSLNAYNANIEMLDIIKSNEPITNNNKIDSLFHPLINDFSSLDLIDGSINEILNTGSLNIIKDAKLRKKLSNWSKTIDDYKDDIKITNDYLFDIFIPSIENKLLLRNTRAPKNLLDANGLKPFTKSNFKIDYNKTLKNIEFENQLYFNALNVLFTLESYTITESYLKELLALIEINIKD